MRSLIILLIFFASCTPQKELKATSDGFQKERDAKKVCVKLPESDSICLIRIEAPREYADYLGREVRSMHPGVNICVYQSWPHGFTSVSIEHCSRIGLYRRMNESL